MSTTVRVHPIRAGEIRLSPAFSIAPPGPAAQARGFAMQLLRAGGTYWAPVPVFAIEHPHEGLILIDAGYDPSVADDPGTTMGWTARWLFDHRPEPVRPQLAERGLGDPAMVVFTHMHQDHLSGLPEFPDAEVIADERELAIARRPSAWRDPGGYHPPIINGHGRVRAIGPGERFDRFEETLDLFGDGSLRILRTPGHTMGHLSVLAQTDTGEILICGDAAHLQRQLDEILEMTIMQDAALFRDSLGRIQAYLRSNPQTVAIPGHDPQAWSSLPDVF